MNIGWGYSFLFSKPLVFVRVSADDGVFYVRTLLFVL